MSTASLQIASARKCRASGAIDGYVHKFRLEAYEAVEGEAPRSPAPARSLGGLVVRLASAGVAASGLLWSTVQLLH